jgi:hypothetical protein
MHTRKNGSAGLAAAIVAAIALDGGAGIRAAEPDPADGPSSLPAIQVTAHYDESIGTSDAASSGIVEGALLQDMAILRPGEILETIPGLVVTQHSGEGKANQYFLRGYNLDHGTDFATRVDGVPVNLPTNGHGQGYSDINFLIPELVDHIDYRKGPYFASNGDFSSAGSADIVYRTTLDRDFVRVTIGEEGYRRVLGAASSTSDAPLAWLAAIEALGNDGPWTHPDAMRKFNGFAKVSGGDSARGWSADAVVYDAHWNATDQVPLDAIESGALCRFCAVDPSDGGRTARDIASWEAHATDDDGYSRASAFVEHYRLALWSNFTYFEDDPVRGDQFEQRDDRNIVGASMVEGWRHDLFGRDSTTEAGLALRADAIHVSLFDTEMRHPFATVSDDRVDERVAGAYVQESTAWTPWFRSVAGLRFDAIDLTLNAQAYPPNSGRSSDTRVSPKLALVFGPWRDTELFVDAGNGFHSNDARGVIGRYDPASGDPASRAPALAGSFGKEIGVRTEAVPGLQSSLSLWTLDSESELVYTADAAGTEINGASRRFGVEWSNHYALGDRFYLDGDLAWTHARYRHGGADGEFIPNAVGKVATLGISMRNVGPWSASAKVEYIGSYPLTQDGTLRAPSSLVTNVRIERALGERIALALDVLNIFDRDFYDIAYAQDYRLAPASPLVANGITVHPGEPRQLRVSCTVRF